MRWDAAMLEGYTDAVAAQQAAARAFVAESIGAFAELNPGASVEELRDYGIEVLAQAYRAYGDRAAVVACQQYDAIAGGFFGGYALEAAAISNDIDMDAIERDARYLSGLAAKRGVGEYARRMAQKAYDHALWAANSTMYENANRPRDRDAGVRYARVPTGSETCGFCLMLASQGFVYRLRESAGGGFNSFHSHCDCRIVVGDDLAEVDGYDQDWLLEVYADARAAVERGAYDEWKALGGKAGTGKGYDKFLTDRVAAEIETRDRDWAWTGKAPEIAAEPGAEPMRKELDCARLLQSHGFAVTFRKTRPSEGKKTSDILIGSVPWEIKQPTGTGRNNIYNQFNEASGQAERLVIDATESPFGFDGVCDRAKAAIDRRDDFTEVLVVDGERLMRIKKTR